MISLSYGFGVVRARYWSEHVSDLSPIQLSKPIRLSIYACIAGMFYLGLFPNAVMKLAAQAVEVLR